MVSFSYQDFHDAIVTNCCSVALSCIGQGLDLNKNLAVSLPRFADATYRESEAEETVVTKADCLVIRNDTGADCISALHLAVVNCYHHPRDVNALTLVQRLISAGASVSSKAIGIFLCSYGVWNRHLLKDGTTPLQLAMHLKRNLQPSYACEQGHMMHQVIETLSCAIRTQSNHPSYPAPQSTMNTWNKLLFSQDFADVTFECPDGTSLHAHKNILAASSDYFRVNLIQMEFWKTTNDSDTMKVVLSFIYTGVLPSNNDSITPKRPPL